MKNAISPTEQLKMLLVALRGHLVVISVVLFASLCAYLLVLATTLLQAQPKATDLTERANAASSPKVSKDIVETIEGLEDRNVQVQTIFEDARENPFTE